MSEGMTVETRLVLSKSFPSGTVRVQFGPYEIRPIPSTRVGESEAVLQFQNSYEAPSGGGSHPEEEANIVCNLLAVVLESRVQRNALRISSTEIPVTPAANFYSSYRSELETHEVEKYLRKTTHLPLDLARQLSRACRAYASALEFIPSDSTFAFFLLVVSVECLSSQAAIISSSELPLDSKKCERFCTFVDRFLPDTGRSNDERDKTLFNELLKTVYYSHRSAFVHGGREVSAAALMADRAGSSYFKHATQGKEVKTPGLGWFAHIVRGALLGYLETVSEQLPNNKQILAELAFEKAVLRLKAARDVGAGQVVTFADIEYR